LKIDSPLFSYSNSGVFGELHDDQIGAFHQRRVCAYVLIRHILFHFLMETHNPQFITVESLNDAKKEIRNIGCDPKSVDIMAPKMVSRVIKLHDVVLQDAIILKQDMLSLGGEVCIPKEAFLLRSALLIFYS
jgi:hypothetical protein